MILSKLFKQKEINQMMIMTHNAPSLSGVTTRNQRWGIRRSVADANTSRVLNPNFT